MHRGLLGVAGAMGFLAVALGAFGAHALAGRLGERGQQLWTLASQYALVHAAVVAALAAGGSGLRGTTAAGLLLAAGVLLFSGSLYGLALGGPRLLGPVTPLGGLLLLAGWGAMGWMSLRG